VTPPEEELACAQAVGKKYSEVMARKLQYRRLLMLTLLLGAAFAGLGYRLVDLQVLRHDDLGSEARQNTERDFQLPPRRGDILDARGELLATSVFVKTVCADPALIGNHQVEVAQALAPLLDVDEGDLIRRLTPRVRYNEKGTLVTNHYMVLKRKVSSDLWQKVQATMAGLALNTAPGDLESKPRMAAIRDLRTKAIYTDPVDEEIRSYPNQSLAAHVLGYTTEVVRTNATHAYEELEGVDGIEYALDPRLRGVRGWRRTEVDVHQRELVDRRAEDVEPRDGLSVVLTIDTFLQKALEDALAEGMKDQSPISATGIIMRPKTGEILAMAVLPNYDPNKLNAPMDAMRNRLISDVHEPGSTFKIIVISSALNDHVVTLNDTFDCGQGVFAYAGHVLHDHTPSGVLTTKGIITRSSNIGAAQVGIRLGAMRLYQHMLDYGIGSLTGIDLPGEVPGLLHPVNQWSKVSIAQIPMGQGVATTSLQMMLAMCAIANHGMMMRPMLVDRLQDSTGNVVARYSPEPSHSVISEEAAREMVEALKTVATPDGTAPKAALEHYTVAGKTGTAQKPPYTANKYYASFIGFFPADDPEVCIYVSMDEPKGFLHQGGQVCAPMFKEVAEKAANYLNIRPDRDAGQGTPDMVMTPSGNTNLRPPEVRAAGL
jgi:cell division protein FtsI/penicillin-binding protein 2